MFKIIKTLLIITILSCTPSYAMKEIIYSHGTNFIDSFAHMACNATLWFVHITHRTKNKPLNLAMYEQKCQQQIKRIHNQLIDDEDKIISDIFNDFEINLEQRIEIVLMTNRYKLYAQEYMSKPHPDATHDAVFPSKAFDDVRKTTGIDLRSIKLINSPIPHEDGFIATSTCFDIQEKNDNDLWTLEKVINPSNITLYPYFWDAFRGYQYAIILHEVGHLASHHSITTWILRHGITHFTGVESEAIWNNKNYDKLCIKHEEQANILYKNADNAYAMRKLYKQIFSKDLFLKHYAKLALIDELHQFPNKLKDYKLIPIQKIPAIKFNGLPTFSFPFPPGAN